MENIITLKKYLQYRDIYEFSDVYSVLSNDYDSAHELILKYEHKSFFYWIAENDFYDDKLQLKIDGDLMDLWLEFKSGNYYLLLQWADFNDNLKQETVTEEIIQFCDDLQVGNFDDFKDLLDNIENSRLVIVRLQKINKIMQILNQNY